MYRVEIFQYGSLERLYTGEVDKPDSLTALTAGMNNVIRDLGYYIFSHALVTRRPRGSRDFEMFVFSMDERGTQHPRRLGIVTLSRNGSSDIPVSP